jgi:uncharacterized membrane protein YfcA
VLYVAAAVLIGLGTGILSGFFGVGGGVVSTPAIRLILDTAPLIALGTPLPVTLPSAISGGLRYARQGLVDLNVALWAVVAGVPFSIAGAYATALMDGHVLMLITAAVIAAVGLDFATGARERRMAREAKATDADADTDTDSDADSDAVAAKATATDTAGVTETAAAPARPRILATGALVGFVSGFLGIGGGILAVPIFLGWLHLPIKRALGTSLLLVACIATPGSIVHFTLGHVDLPLAGLLTLGVVPGAWVGAGMASRLSDSRLIKAFGLFLLAVAAVFTAEEVRIYLR